MPRGTATIFLLALSVLTLSSAPAAKCSLAVGSLNDEIVDQIAVRTITIHTSGNIVDPKITRARVGVGAICARF
jgi:hypothetical protein